MTPREWARLQGFPDDFCFPLADVHLYKQFGNNTMAQVTKETMIGELLNINIDAAAPVLLGIGMHCLGCPASQMETIEEAAAVHGVDADELVRTLNEKLAEASAE